MLVIEVDERVAMDAVDGEDDHDGEIRDEERGVEGVPGVETFEGLVGVLGLEKVTEAVGSVEGQVQGDRQTVEKTDDWIQDACNRGDQKTPPGLGRVGCCYSVMIRQAVSSYSLITVLQGGVLRLAAAMA
jgi:hypothetical protein